MPDDDLTVLAVHVLAAGVADQVSLWIGIIVGLVTIGGAIAAVFGARRRATDRAAVELARSFQAGRDDRNDEVALLKSQLGDAREDRDEARRRLELLEGRVLDYGRSLPPPLPPHRPGPGASS